MLATREQMFDHGQPSYAEVNHDVIKALTTTTWRYWVALGISAGTALLFFMAPWMYQIMVGVGAAGMNRNAMWGTYLSNFIFWIGLSHSGTLLSAVLHITQSDWRKSIYRSAEAMTGTPGTGAGRATFARYILPSNSMAPVSSSVLTTVRYSRSAVTGVR